MLQIGKSDHTEITIVESSCSVFYNRRCDLLVTKIFKISELRKYIFGIMTYLFAFCYYLKIINLTGNGKNEIKILYFTVNYLAFQFAYFHKRRSIVGKGIDFISLRRNLFTY